MNVLVYESGYAAGRGYVSPCTIYWKCIGRSWILACQGTFLCAKSIWWPSDYQWCPCSWFTHQVMGGEAVCWHSLTWARSEGWLSCHCSLTLRFHNPELVLDVNQSSAPHLPCMEIMGCYHTKPQSQPYKHVLALHRGKSLWSFVILAV